MLEKLKRTDDDVFRWEDESGCHWESRLDYLCIKVLGFCGCGDPAQVMDYTKEILEALDGSEWRPYEDMPYMFFVYWANDKEFAEHGTTARCSWLTEKGKELLADIITVQKLGD